VTGLSEGTATAVNDCSFIQMDVDWDRTARLKEIKTPSIYIAGALGSETSVRATTICHNALPGSEMVVFQESSHMPIYEEPNKYLKVVRDFIHRTELRAPAPSPAP
jgi:pimeloyl-ACP methyl ester carboxylesterase